MCYNTNSAWDPLHFDADLNPDHGPPRSAWKKWVRIRIQVINIPFRFTDFINKKAFFSNGPLRDIKILNNHYFSTVQFKF